MKERTPRSIYRISPKTWTFLRFCTLLILGAGFCMMLDERTHVFVVPTGLVVAVSIYAIEFFDLSQTRSVWDYIPAVRRLREARRAAMSAS